MHLLATVYVGRGPLNNKERLKGRCSTFASRSMCPRFFCGASIENHGITNPEKGKKMSPHDF